MIIIFSNAVQAFLLTNSAKRVFLLTNSILLRRYEAEVMKILRI